jgi:hypothetical protein
VRGAEGSAEGLAEIESGERERVLWMRRRGTTGDDMSAAVRDPLAMRSGS